MQTRSLQHLSRTWRRQHACRAVGLLAALQHVLCRDQSACKALQAVKRRSQGPQKAALHCWRGAQGLNGASGQPELHWRSHRVSSSSDSSLRAASSKRGGRSARTEAPLGSGSAPTHPGGVQPSARAAPRCRQLGSLPLPPPSPPHSRCCRPGCRCQPTATSRSTTCPMACSAQQPALCPGRGWPSGTACWTWRQCSERGCCRAQS